MRRNRNSSAFFLLFLRLCIALAIPHYFRNAYYSLGKVLSSGYPPGSASHASISCTPRPVTPPDKTARRTPPGRHLLPAISPSLLSALFVSFQSLLLLRSLTRRAASGDEGTRTPDFRLAKAALSHLSYIPATSGPDRIRTCDPCVISTVL